MIQKLAWLALLVSLSSVLLYGAPQMADEKASATKTVTGCLQKGTEHGGFFLISTDDKHWELYSKTDVSLADHVGHLGAHQRHTGRAADQHHTPNLGGGHAGIGQHVAGDIERALGISADHRFELRSRERME